MSSTELFADDDILDDDPVDAQGRPLEVLHDREYRVRAFRSAPDRVLIRGGVRDQKPPGLYLDVDPDPLTIHHMQVDIDDIKALLNVQFTRVRSGLLDSCRRAFGSGADGLGKWAQEQHERGVSESDIAAAIGQISI